MNRNELDRLIRKFVSEPSPDTENILKNVFNESILKIVRTVRQVKDAGLEYDEDEFHSFCKIQEFCENMTSFEIDSIDTGSDVVILRIIPAPSGSLMCFNKNYFCDNYLNRELDRLIQTVKDSYQRQFTSAKKQFDECSDKLTKANTLTVEL